MTLATRPLPSHPPPRRTLRRAGAALLLGLLPVGVCVAQGDEEIVPKPPSLQTGPLILTFGGFIELAGVWRSRNETADIGSNFGTGIPMRNLPASRVSEFRFSARQSRISLLAQTQPYAGGRAEAYLEADFLGAAPTANSVESNSYTPRTRHVYARYITDQGYVLAGQTWSLVTLYKRGLESRQEVTPLTIDPQYVVGFDWTRNPQLRLVKTGDFLSFGLSLESPQAIVAANNNVPASIVIGGNTVTLSPYPANTAFSNAGGSYYAPTTNYTLDVAPDVVVKAAADSGFGHFELFGLGRFFRSTVAGEDQTTFGGGVGGGAVVPIIPDLVQVQASGMWGRGIGRYASGQLPDVTVQPDGTLSTITAYHLLFGGQYTPSSMLTIYGYVGREKEGSQSYRSTLAVAGTVLGPYSYGYGAAGYNNSGCNTLGSTLCAANISDVNEITGGFWWKYYRGQLGNLQFGVQGAYLQRHSFGGIGGAPSANLFIAQASFRFYPYQK